MQFRKSFARLTKTFKYYLVLLCLMESITIKVDEGMAKAIDFAMKPLYATKTEFIREAIRDKVRAERLRRLEENFGKGKGTAKTNMTDEEIREEVAQEYLKKFKL